MGALAPTTLAIGPDDKLIKIDAYKALNKVINIKDNIENLLNDTLKSFLPNNNILDTAKIILGKGINGLKLDIDALKKGLISNLNGLLSNFNNLPDVIKNSLMKIDGYNQIKVIIDDVEKIINKADLTTINGLAALVQGISGCTFNIRTKDQSGTIALGTNLIRDCSKLGLFEAYKAFTKCITDKSITGNITKNLLNYVKTNSDFKLLKEIMNGPHAGDILKYAPNIIKDFCKNFKNSKDYTNTTIFNDCFDSFNIINPSLTTNSILDFSMFSEASSDFKNILNTGRSNIRTEILDFTSVDTSEYPSIDQVCGINDLAGGFDMSDPFDSLQSELSFGL